MRTSGQDQAQGGDEQSAADAGRVRLSLFLRLLIVIVSLVLGVASLLASYLISRQVREMQTDLELKASTYGRLVSKEVESAVAFGDRATAREVFDSLAQDDDVEGLALFTSRGTLLHARGTISPSLPVSPSRVTQPLSFSRVSRIGVMVPVVSLEGPRGALVVELSTRRLHESRAAVVKRAVGACLLAVLAGTLGAFLIARSLARRVRAIATVANAVAAGDLSQRPVPEDGARDEIATTAAAFNAMLRQQQALVAQIRQSAHEEQARLETLVAARTAELAGRNDDMRRVLDNVGQGFLTVDPQGRMSRERSAILETWFGPAPESGLLVDYLGRVDPAMSKWFAACWESVLDGLLPLEVAIGQLPRRMNVSPRNFEVDYRPILDSHGKLERMAIVVTDATAAVERARAETDEREVTRLFKRLIADRAGFLEFFSEAATLVARSSSGANDLAARKRALHTLKGNALLYGVDSVAVLCHALEDRLAEHGDLGEADLAPLIARWREVAGKIRELVGEERNRLEVDDADYAKLCLALERGTSHAKLREMVLAWRLEPTQLRLARIAEQAEALAVRLGKAPILVEIEANELRLAPEQWGPFWSAAVHVIRNAIDHGLEPADERQDSGKSGPGRVRLRTYTQGPTFAIEFSDDGRGIDWDAVRKKAVALGISSQTHADLKNALCTDGMSTKDSVTELSGRGVGLGAVRRACEDLGGQMEVESVPGHGTTIRFVWPLTSLAAPPQQTPRSTPPPAAAVGFVRAG